MKKIYRLSKQKKIAGICAGIGELYAIDPTIVRLILVFGTVATCIWPCAVAYLVGWFLIPDNDAMPVDEK